MAQYGTDGYAYLPCDKLPIKTVHLHQPPLNELAEVLQQALAKNFSESSVSVVRCPDLSLAPFNFMSAGLGGQCSLLDIGSSTYLAPVAQKNKLYDLKDIVHALGLESAFILGASLGPWPHVGVNCEMIANLSLNNGIIMNQSRIAYIVNDACQIDLLPSSETRCSIVANLFCCKGQTDEVLQVKCKGRVGQEDIISCMQQSMQTYYKDKIIGLGGALLLSGSSAKQHIMPQFSDSPLNTAEDLKNWTKFYEHSAPLVAVGTLVSNDPGLNLRVQHFHGINSVGEGGHFYSDTQPKKADYTGYFAVGKLLHKIDQPQ